jgi:hypothetical protein
MTRKKKTPTAKHSIREERPVGHFFLRIDENGTESTSSSWLPQHEEIALIEVGAGKIVEQIKVLAHEQQDVLDDDGGLCMLAFSPGRPPAGKGWRIHDDSADKYALWRRPHRGDGGRP